MTIILIRIYLRHLAVIILLLWGASALPAWAEDTPSTVPQTWQMLDYLATDYAGAVKDGAVISASEYAEMREFTSTARLRIGALPPTASTPELLKEPMR